MIGKNTECSSNHPLGSQSPIEVGHGTAGEKRQGKDRNKSEEVYETLVTKETCFHINTHQCPSFLARVTTVMVVTLARSFEVGMWFPHIVYPLVAWRLKQLVHLLQQGVPLQTWHQSTHVVLQANV